VGEFGLIWGVCGRGISSGIINKLHTCLATANLYIFPHWQSYGHDLGGKDVVQQEQEQERKQLDKTGGVHRNIFHRDSSERRRHSAGAVSTGCQGALLVLSRWIAPSESKSFAG